MRTPWVDGVVLSCVYDPCMSWGVVAHGGGVRPTTCPTDRPRVDAPAPSFAPAPARDARRVRDGGDDDRQDAFASSFSRPRVVVGAVCVRTGHAQRATASIHPSAVRRQPSAAMPARTRAAVAEEGANALVVASTSSALDVDGSMTHARHFDALDARDVREVLASVEDVVATRADARAWCTYATAERFLRADKGDVRAAKKRLRTTMEWRVQAKPERSCCTKCFGKSLGSHYMQHVGFDKRGRALVYSDIGLAMDRRPASNVEHCVQVLELLEKFLPPYPNDQYIWICDFHKFGVGNMNPSVAYKCLSLFARSYPERLELMVFVEAPKIFNGLYKTLTAFIDSTTVQKLRFAKGPEGKGGGVALEGVLRKHLNDETTDWLLTEMRMNRRMWSTVSKHKTWLGSMIKGDGIMAHTENTEFANHDNRGTPEFIASPAGQHAMNYARKHAVKFDVASSALPAHCFGINDSPRSVMQFASTSAPALTHSFSFATLSEVLDGEFDRFE